MNRIVKFIKETKIYKITVEMQNIINIDSHTQKRKHFENIQFHILEKS